MYLEFLKAKNEYIAASHKAAAAGMAAASGGNISVRIAGTDKLLVKPSGITLGEAAEENLIVTDLHGELVEGNIKPTKETILHGGLYRLMPEIGGIVHAHPVYSIRIPAWAAQAAAFSKMEAITAQMSRISCREDTAYFWASDILPMIRSN